MSVDTQGLDDQAVKDKIVEILGLPDATHVGCYRGLIALNVSWRKCAVDVAKLLIESGGSGENLPDTWFNQAVKRHLSRLCRESRSKTCQTPGSTKL